MEIEIREKVLNEKEVVKKKSDDAKQGSQTVKDGNGEIVVETPSVEETRKVSLRISLS